MLVIRTRRICLTTFFAELWTPDAFAPVIRIVQLFEAQKFKCPEVVALTVIKAYAKTSMPDKALDGKEFQKVKGLLDWIRIILAKGSNVVGARKMFDEMPEKGMIPDVTCYNILINGFFKQGDYVK
ncbi:hypothetical protein SLEP1_g17921 [Rubroshorea leprosula]|uniref:Pentatricopeptide repeat-containing protein n=1 Tax=Rubroshorea leprosula TaxID=152421 RepID=A0AAV5J508_9ROSI|nr:hypothetical protein SLEP1_g17921 [Rubroshorea leprosula]